MLGISCLGIIFRVMRILFPSFSKMLLLRKVHGSQLNGIIMSSGECFVLELVIDNLSNTPMFIDSVLTEVAANMKEVSYRRSTKDSYRKFIYNYHDDVEASAPLIQEERNHNHESTRLSPILPETKSQFGTQHENIVKKSIEIDHQDKNDDNVKTLTPNEKDTLIDLQEVAKPTSKKKKNKKNQKVPTNDSEDGKKKPKVEAGSVVLNEKVSAEVNTKVNADSTVVSFLEDSHLSQDWL